MDVYLIISFSEAWKICFREPIYGLGFEQLAEDSMLHCSSGSSACLCLFESVVELLGDFQDLDFVRPGGT